MDLIGMRLLSDVSVGHSLPMHSTLSGEGSTRTDDSDHPGLNIEMEI
jgi:hypothetical protein